MKTTLLAVLCTLFSVTLALAQPARPVTRPVPTPLPPRAGSNPNTSTPTQFNGAVPNVASDLTVTRTKNPEFIEYVKQLATESGEVYGKLTTAAAAGAQKVIWQITTSPFGPTANAADWKTPAGLVTSGATAAASGSTMFTVNLFSTLGKAPASPKRLYLRALVIKNDLLVARPSNTVILDYGTGKSVVVKDTSTNNLPKDPAVYSQVTIVGYNPPVFNTDPYALILTKKPTGELKLVLEKINVTSPGTKFHLSPDEYEKLKNKLSLDQKLSVAVQDFLKALKSGYNWLDDKFHYIANKLASLLSPIVGESLARKIVNYYLAVYGLNPSYGNFEETLDTGKAAFEAFLMDNGDVPENKKGSIVAGAGSFIDDVKAASNGGDDPAKFYRQNPEFAARPAIVTLHVKYTGVNGVSPTTRGGKRKFKVSIMSGRAVNKEYITSTGNLQFAPIPLFENLSVAVPNAKPGTEFDVPVYVDFTPTYKNDKTTWMTSYSTNDPAVITAGNDTLKVVSGKKYNKP